ncbi:MAG: type 4a pilus biogenesis protein PilO [Candidatus Omnitrophica bacterium]|nr:type 4a pilus biogenesis protein PilO [Candidatus Omnitrophota bacterium]
MPPQPPKKITSLHQIDISKLDVKDLQNIDFQKILKDARQRPDTAIAFAVPILALFICFNIFTKSQNERRIVTTKIKEMEAKVKLVDEYNTAQEEFQTFLDTMPAKITEDEFITKITDFAVKNHVQIESFSPAQNKSDPIYDLKLINLTANAQDFNDMGHFIQDIENSGLSIRINSWNGNMGPQAQGGARRAIDPNNPNGLVINFRLEVASVTFKQ